MIQAIFFELSSVKKTRARTNGQKDGGTDGRTRSQRQYHERSIDPRGNKTCLFKKSISPEVFVVGRCLTHQIKEESL